MIMIRLSPMYAICGSKGEGIAIPFSLPVFCGGCFPIKEQLRFAAGWQPKAPAETDLSSPHWRMLLVFLALRWVKRRRGDLGSCSESPCCSAHVGDETSKKASCVILPHLFQVGYTRVKCNQKEKHSVSFIELPLHFSSCLDYSRNLEVIRSRLFIEL